MNVPADGTDEITRAGELRDCLQLTKPGLNALVLFSTAIGFYLAIDPANPAFPTFPFDRLLCTLLGTGLTAGGAAALNQYRERCIDARMRRTAQRPLPAGRLRPARALMIGACLSTAGLLVLMAWVNALTSALAACSLILYLNIYTPLKRVSPTAALVGSVSGALPPVLGWTGATGRLSIFPLMLFLILYLWQIPHFLAIAWKWRADYAAAGLPVLTVYDPSGHATGRQALLFSAALWPVSLMPTICGCSGLLYGFSASALGILLVAAGLGFARRPSPHAARGLFIATIVYLPLLLLVLVADRLFK